MPQAGYLALFSGWITRGIVLPFSGGALFGYDKCSHIVSDLSTQYVSNVVLGFLMDKKKALANSEGFLIGIEGD